MTALDPELRRLQELDQAVRHYLSHLWMCEQEGVRDDGSIDRWRDEMQRLTED
jgi:hypothetical protein